MTPTDQEILEAIAELFVAGGGVWPFPREVAEKLGARDRRPGVGDGVPGLTGRLASLMKAGRVAYHCTGGSRRVVLLLDPKQVNWHREVAACKELAGRLCLWLESFGLSEEEQLAAVRSDSFRSGDYYAAFLISQQNQEVAA